MISIINDLDEVRNEYGNAHGKSKRNYKPETSHASLAINSARTITEFLLSSYKNKSRKYLRMKKHHILLEAIVYSPIF